MTSQVIAGWLALVYSGGHAGSGERNEFFTVRASLGTPSDLTLDELRFESFFPADAATDEHLRRFAAGPT